MRDLLTHPRPRSCPRISVPPWRTARTAKQIAMEMGTEVELGESSQATSSTSGRRWFESDLFGVAWVLTAGLAVLSPPLLRRRGNLQLHQLRGPHLRGNPVDDVVVAHRARRASSALESLRRVRNAVRLRFSVGCIQPAEHRQLPGPSALGVRDPTHLHHHRGRNRGVRVRTSVGAWGDWLCFRRHRLRTRRSILGVLGIVGLLGHVLDRMALCRRPAHHSWSSQGSLDRRLRRRPRLGHLRWPARDRARDSFSSCFVPSGLGGSASASPRSS